MTIYDDNNVQKNDNPNYIIMTKQDSCANIRWQNVTL